MILLCEFASWTHKCKQSGLNSGISLYLFGSKILSPESRLSLVILLLFVSGARCSPSRSCDCPMNVTSTMGETDQLNGLFRGLFNNDSNLVSFLEDGFQVQDWTDITTLDKPNKCQGQRQGRGQDNRCGDGMVDTEDVTINLADCCCESKQFIIKPLTVQQDRETFDVVHLPDAPQLISTSTCSKSNKSCGSGGTCMEMKGYTWILIYDVRLKYYPPVKFVPIKFPSGCACVF